MHLSPSSAYMLAVTRFYVQLVFCRCVTNCSHKRDTPYPLHSCRDAFLMSLALFRLNCNIFYFFFYLELRGSNIVNSVAPSAKWA